MHAYNIGIVKYDYKILMVVTKILAKEIKHLFVKEVDVTDDKPQKVNNCPKILPFSSLILGKTQIDLSPDNCHNQHDSVFVFWYFWNTWGLKLSFGHFLFELGSVWFLLLYYEDDPRRVHPLCALYLRCIRLTLLPAIIILLHKGKQLYYWNIKVFNCFLF